MATTVTQQSLSSFPVLTVTPPNFAVLTAYRPDAEEVKKTSEVAKRIFVEAFTTTYTKYHQSSGSSDSIETWLRLRNSLSLEQWLSDTFDEEYEEFLEGQKGFVYLTAPDGHLVGWLSHSPVNAKGELYLSQCSLEADARNQKVATTAFAEALKENHIHELFAGITQVKLIARKINEAAEHLYTRAGFIKDETIDPSVYGDSYDDRYIGYRLELKLPDSL